MSTVDNALALRAAALKVREDLECPHASTYYGNCSDCMGTGILVTCQEEADVLAGVDLILEATDNLRAEP
jgi:hypothetical protein